MTRLGTRMVRVVLIGVAAVYLMPFYVSVTYALKTPIETASNPLGLPSDPTAANFVRAIEISDFFTALWNNAIVTAGTIVVIIGSASSAAYVIARVSRQWTKVLYMAFVGAIVLPFQVVMFPLYRNIRALGLLNTLPGLIIAISGLQLGFSIFLYAGFVTTVPKELEESAFVDGASTLTTFRRIVFPLLQPVTATVAILAGITAWNDFQSALILVQRPEVRTLPLTQFFFVGQYSIEINTAFAAFTLSMIPIVVFYAIAQRRIAAGLIAGALKG